MKPTTPAEHLLLEDARAGRPTDRRTPEESADRSWRPTAKEAADWGSERIVRAKFLAHLLVDQRLRVQLTGARIDGHLKVPSLAKVSLSAPRCIFTGRIGFRGAEFTGEASFTATTFTGNATFDGATFTRNAYLTRATFASKATFAWTTFTRIASFKEVAFTGQASFAEATFTGEASFTAATFTRNASFTATTFTRIASFKEVAFNGDVWFSGAAFAGVTSFKATTFTGDTSFQEAICSGDVSFARATFTGGIVLSGVRASVLDFSEGRWDSGRVDTADLACVDASFGDAVFEKPLRLDVTCASLDLSGVQARSRLHLVVAGAQIECRNADFAAGTLIEGAVSPPADPVWFPDLAHPSPPELETGEERMEREQAECNGEASVWSQARGELAGRYGDELEAGKRAAIVSFDRARVSGVTITGMDLSQCRFAGADGLDRLVVADSNTLTRWRDHDRRKWVGWWRTSRRMIADEFVSAELTPDEDTAGAGGAPAGGEAADEGKDSEAADKQVRVEDAAAGGVAATYRSLRKALEDNKDEPGAADFYYGEMEMRRRAADKWSVERWLLTAYWAVSGYGLRAWRAITALIAVVLAAAYLFTLSVFASVAPKPPVVDAVDLGTGKITYGVVGDPEGLSFGQAALFSARETVALFRTNQTDVALTDWGHVIDLGVRVIGPVLLALAVLAIRNRTKR